MTLHFQLFDIEFFKLNVVIFISISSVGVGFMLRKVFSTPKIIHNIHLCFLQVFFIIELYFTFEASGIYFDVSGDMEIQFILSLTASQLA